MIEIGGKPILWHIMKNYSHYGFNEFIICLGYKGEYVREWFNNYYLHNSDVTFDLEKNTTTFHKNRSEKWKVTLVDTGDQTLTGGRVKRIKDYIGNETFMLTYGDGVGNIDIGKLAAFHKEHGKLATVTVVVPEGRFGTISVDNTSHVMFFGEKMDNKYRINGGFFVLEPKVFDYIKDDATVFEREPLERLVRENQLKAYFHEDFWKPMDTLPDKNRLEEMWRTGNAPWKIWKK